MKHISTAALKCLCTNLIIGAVLTFGAVPAFSAPVENSWAVVGPDETVAVGAARLAGIYAAADSYEDNVEIRDIRQTLRRTISAAEISALLPWMQLTGGPDGPSAIAVSDSGREVYVLVHDEKSAGDGNPSDGILLYDTLDDELTLFARLELFAHENEPPLLSAVHHAGKLYAGTGLGEIKVYRAGLSTTNGTLLETALLPDASPVRGLAIDSDNHLLFAAGSNSIYRANLNGSPLTFSPIGQVGDIQAITFSQHYGGANNAGLYVLSAITAQRIVHVSIDQARGLQDFAPTIYQSFSGASYDICATACGRLLCGALENAVMISDNSDARLGFNAWVTNEFDQQIAFAKNLIAPDGKGPGWVVDADVQQGWNRFHPASPDAACWAGISLLLLDEIHGSPSARLLMQDILKRYAGQAVDNIIPETNADGIPRHWYEPSTGSTNGEWNPEFAVMSKMKLNILAVRAQNYYTNDAIIRGAAQVILNANTNAAAYINTNADTLYLRALTNGGPDLTSPSDPFHEGILFVEQAASYTNSVAPVYARWLDASLWPACQLVARKPVTGDNTNGFQAAFVSLYPYLLQKDFRDSLLWQQSVNNLWYSHALWNDENGPRYLTVFSAGTTPAGYNADSLSYHPDDIATFPSLLAFCSKGDTAPAVGAYHAYRRGARQTFAGGASILYRRSNLNPSWQPNSAGLPDVALGAVGLAELLEPGIVDKILALDMHSEGMQLRKLNSQIELLWPRLGWRIQQSDDLGEWYDLTDIPNPYRLDPAEPKSFYRIHR